MPTTKGLTWPQEPPKMIDGFYKPRHQNCKNASKVIKPTPKLQHGLPAEKSYHPNTIGIFWGILPIVRYWPFGGHGGVEG
jgi:hypothetical protein